MDARRRARRRAERPNDDALTDVDGLATKLGDPPPTAADGDAEHPIGALRIDHLVVTTPDLDRTVRAIERTTRPAAEAHPRRLGDRSAGPAGVLPHG